MASREEEEEEEGEGRTRERRRRRTLLLRQQRRQQRQNDAGHRESMENAKDESDERPMNSIRLPTNGGIVGSELRRTGHAVGDRLCRRR